MIQRLLIACLLFCFTLSAQAQMQGQRSTNTPREGRGFSKEEFRNRQEKFLTKKAQLSKEEAEKFFPLFFELQDKKKEVNDKAWKSAQKGKEESTTDKEYEEIVDKLVQARIDADKLDLQYLKSFKKILPAKKIYLIQMGEIRFQRELLRAVSGESGERRGHENNKEKR
ncbi:MAG: hypothetical protein ACRC3Z_04850 [Phocaeicola sp.]